MTQWIGRYWLVTVVGTGAFATVHRAVDERLGDTVAVKVLAENHSLDPDVRERFISEGRVLRRVDSPHVVAVHDLGETERGQPYLVLEFADRGTLADRAGMLRAQGWRAGVDDLLAVARSLAEALRAVHRADLVHRDLSPGNMLLRSTVADEPHPPGARIVGPDERLLVADLGLCKDLAVHSGLTAAGGTEGFRPPEQRVGPGTVDARADLWALSALLTWIATGHAPGARTASTLIAEAGLPRRLGPVLDTGLADDPAKRHPDVTTWLTEVEDALAEPQPRPPDPAPPADPPSPPRLRRRAAALALAAVVGAGATAGGVTLLGGPDIAAQDDGGVRVARSAGDIEVAMVGPRQIAVGETATFTAEVRGVTSWVWLAPDGVAHTDAPSLQVRAASAGIAPVRLVGLAADGRRVEVDHDLRVTE